MSQDSDDEQGDVFGDDEKSSGAELYRSGSGNSFAIESAQKELPSTSINHFTARWFLALGSYFYKGNATHKDLEKWLSKAYADVAPTLLLAVCAALLFFSNTRLIVAAFQACQPVLYWGSLLVYGGCSVYFGPGKLKEFLESSGLDFSQFKPWALQIGFLGLCAIFAYALWPITSVLFVMLPHMLFMFLNVTMAGHFVALLDAMLFMLHCFAAVGLVVVGHIGFGLSSMFGSPMGAYGRFGPDGCAGRFGVFHAGSWPVACHDRRGFLSVVRSFISQPPSRLGVHPMEGFC